jgi:hypothetical protein
LFLIVWEPFRCLLANSKRAVICLLLRSGFRLDTLPSCRDSCPSGKFSHLYRGTLELCQSYYRFLGHLPDQGPSPPIAQFGWAASSRKSLGGSKLLPFKNNGGHCVLGDLQCCRHFLVPFPGSVPRHNPVSELYGQFLRPHGLVFALTCTVNCGTLCRQVCAFPNHVQSIECTTGGLQSGYRNISRMINGNRMLNWPS